MSYWGTVLKVPDSTAQTYFDPNQASISTSPAPPQLSAFCSDLQPASEVEVSDRTDVTRFDLSLRVA